MLLFSPTYGWGNTIIHQKLINLVREGIITLEGIDLLRFENVTYRSEKNESLIDISFSLNKGENIVIFGSEDSGVEIICPLIAGLVKEYQGNIFFKGKIIKSFDYIETHDYRKEIGYLQRDYGLISNMTVLENISLPLKYHSELSSEEIEDIVTSYIKEMNLVHCKNFRPVNLTRSEKLRTAYLRSIVLNPDMILVEHSLAGQCLINVQTFLKSLRKESFSKSKSAIFVTFDPNLFVDLADKFIMLYNGEIVFMGSKTDFALNDNQFVRQYMRSSIEGPMSIM